MFAMNEVKNFDLQKLFGLFDKKNEAQLRHSKTGSNPIK